MRSVVAELSLAACLSWALALSGRAAAQGLALPEPAPETTMLAARAQFGLATVPFAVGALPEAKGQALSFLVDGARNLTGSLWLGLRLPLVAASVEQPAGSYVDATAWGNPSLRLTARGDARRLGPLALLVDVGGEVGAPLARHARSLLPNRALAIAGGIEGQAEPGLFTPGVLPVTAFTQVTLLSPRWSVSASLQLPLLVRVSDADLPPADSRTRSLGFTPVLAVQGAAVVVRSFGVALLATVALDLRPPVAEVRDVPLAQFLVRASPFFHLGRRTLLLVDLQAPVGGALGGTSAALGLRALFGW
jgi:hypothetical protein